MFLLILYISIALGVSFVCSCMEAVILSITPSYIKGLENKDVKTAATLWGMKNNIDQTLAAILTLNTIANTLGATAAGAQAQKVFGNMWVTLFAVLLTLAILIFSEIIPKTIGAVYWRGLAPMVGHVLKVVVFLLYPFTLISRHIMRIISSGNEKKLSYYRQDIANLVEMGEDEGDLTPWEEKVIKNILILEERKIKDIMTPRTVMFALKKGLNVEEAMNENRFLSFARIPVYENDLDNLIGIVLRHDILEEAARGSKETSIGSFLRPLNAIPESISVARTFERFINEREHIFQVVDEYGGTAGIVTMEDAVELMLGEEIVDETDTVVDMRELAVRLWRHRERAGGKNR